MTLLCILFGHKPFRGARFWLNGHLLRRCDRCGLPYEASR